MADSFQFGALDLHRDHGDDTFCSLVLKRRQLVQTTLKAFGPDVAECLT